ncbi:pectinesterase [Sarracenia purpurea var. burkii]
MFIPSDNSSENANICGTIDFIFGNDAVVFRACNVISRMPILGQFTVITAQSWDPPNEDSGIFRQNCLIVASDDYYLYSNYSSNITNSRRRIIESYLGTVYIESYVEDFITPAAWAEWNSSSNCDHQGQGPYENSRPASGT